MKENPKISVVVPVYKVEEYLEECVQSILRQSYEDFELILVDDGSPDSCGESCDEYAKKDARVRVIHKDNGGLSDARNFGINVAAGEYISFIDSDDFVTDNYLEYLLTAAEKYDADMVCSNHTTFPDKIGTAGPDRMGNTFDVKEFSTEEALRDFLLNRTQYTNVWAKLYRRELLESIRFPVGKLSEDEYTTYRLILKAKKVVCLPQRIYYYRLRAGSIVHSFSEERFEVVDEVPDLLRRAVREAGYQMEPELDYKDMRLQMKTYNIFVQHGQYPAYKKKLDAMARHVTELKADKNVWDKKYLRIRAALKTAPAVYRKIVLSKRRDQYGSDASLAKNRD